MEYAPEGIVNHSVVRLRYQLNLKKPMRENLALALAFFMNVPL
jgi:hypothetical protein